MFHTDRVDASMLVKTSVKKTKGESGTATFHARVVDLTGGGEAGAASVMFSPFTVYFGLYHFTIS